MALKSSNTHSCKLVIATALMLGLLTTASQAYTLEQGQMCSGDAMRLCGHEIPNVQRITACMHKQRANVSAGCRAVMDRDNNPARRRAAAAGE